MLKVVKGSRFGITPTEPTVSLIFMDISDKEIGEMYTLPDTKQVNIDFYGEGFLEG